MEIQIRAFGFLINEEAHAFSHQGDRYFGAGRKKNWACEAGLFIDGTEFFDSLCRKK